MVYDVVLQLPDDIQVILLSTSRFAEAHKLHYDIYGQLWRQTDVVFPVAEGKELSCAEIYDNDELIARFVLREQ
jgi:hypothetical protein